MVARRNPHTIVLDETDGLRRRGWGARLLRAMVQLSLDRNADAIIEQNRVVGSYQR
jgi:hypothetical protein